MDAARRLESAAIDYELAQSAFAVARRQHEVGLTTDIEWERAQLDHVNARSRTGTRWSATCGRGWIC